MPMSPFFAHFGALMISVVTAIAIIVTALVWKDTPYENTFFIVLAVGSVLANLFEAYARKKR